jgi:hypothetical protein
MTKAINVDFYRVTPPDGQSFRDMLHAIGDLPIDQRNLDMGEHPARLQSVESWNQCYEGEMVRIRMDSLPQKASLDGALEDLDLQDDEGLGEETAFLYHHLTRTLAIQRNRFGVPASSFAWYVKEKNGVDRPIVLDPILETAVLERLDQVKFVRKLDITLAGLSTGTSLRNRGYGVGDIVRLSENFSAPRISIELSMGRERRGSLLVDRAVGALRSLAGVAADNTDEVQKLKVTGITDSDERVVLDLIEERMKETVLVSDQARTVTYEARRGAIREAWTKRGEELRVRFARAERP